MAAPLTETTTPSSVSPDTRLALLTLGAAAALGVLGDAAFRNTEPGLNVPVWIGALAAAAAALGAASGRRVAHRWLVIALGFATCFAIRAAEFLLVLDMMAIMLALALAGMPPGFLSRVRLRDFAAGLVRSAGWSVAGLFALLIGDVEWKQLGGARSHRARQVVLGLLLATPVLLLFGGLFASADPAFESLARGLFGGWNAELLFEHAVLIGFLSWIAAGLLRTWLARPRAGDFMPQGDVKLDVVPVSMAVGTMLLLFTVFVAIQARWLFGGAGLVEQVTGLSYAEYARTGFFQMVVASGLALPVLYGAEAVLTDADAAARQRVRLMGRLQLVLMGVVMASALHRLALYMGVFGLTQDRIVAVAVIAWVALVSGWFAVTVLRGRGERFLLGALNGGFAVLAALNAVNPDALIARVNLDRVAEGRPVDVAYLKELDADAIPVLVERLAVVPENARCDLLLRMRRNVAGERDWRGWNYSVSRGRATMQAGGLDQVACAEGSATSP